MCIHRRGLHKCVYTKGAYINVYTQTGPIGWLRLVGFLKSYVFFAKEPYKRDYTTVYVVLLRIYTSALHKLFIYSRGLHHCVYIRGANIHVYTQTGPT